MSTSELSPPPEAKQERPLAPGGETAKLARWLIEEFHLWDSDGCFRFPDGLTLYRDCPAYAPAGPPDLLGDFDEFVERLRRKVVVLNDLGQLELGKKITDISEVQAAHVFNIWRAAKTIGD